VQIVYSGLLRGLRVSVWSESVAKARVEGGRCAPLDFDGAIPGLRADWRRRGPPQRPGVAARRAALDSAAPWWAAAHAARATSAAAIIV
jgi:hypothetical protein